MFEIFLTAFGGVFPPLRGGDGGLGDSLSASANPVGGVAVFRRDPDKEDKVLDGR